MNKKSVLSVIYGIAVFVAFVSAVALLYGAIELLCNTTFYDYSYDGVQSTYYVEEPFYEVQAPLGSYLLVTAIVAIVGSICSLFAAFGKKTAVKKVAFCTVCAVVLVAVVFLIAGASVWNTYYQGTLSENGIYPSGPAHIRGGVAASVFAIYSAFMSSMVQLLAIFVVIVALLVCLALMSRKQGRAIASDADVGQDAQDTVE